MLIHELYSGLKLSTAVRRRNGARKYSIDSIECDALKVNLSQFLRLMWNILWLNLRRFS